MTVKIRRAIRSEEDSPPFLDWLYLSFGLGSALSEVGESYVENGQR